jgi:hypothetical protein
MALAQRHAPHKLDAEAGRCPLGLVLKEKRWNQ